MIRYGSLFFSHFGVISRHWVYRSLIFYNYFFLLLYLTHRSLIWFQRSETCGRFQCFQVFLWILDVVVVVFVVELELFFTLKLKKNNRYSNSTLNTETIHTVIVVCMLQKNDKRFLRVCFLFSSSSFCVLQSQCSNSVVATDNQQHTNECYWISSTPPAVTLHLLQFFISMLFSLSVLISQVLAK